MSGPSQFTLSYVMCAVMFDEYPATKGDKTKGDGVIFFDE
jgi:hypothetical protein